MEFGQVLNATARDDADTEILAACQEVTRSAKCVCVVRQKLPALCRSPCRVLTETVTETADYRNVGFAVEPDFLVVRGAL